MILFSRRWRWHCVVSRRCSRCRRRRVLAISELWHVLIVRLVVVRLRLSWLVCRLIWRWVLLA